MTSKKLILCFLPGKEKVVRLFKKQTNELNEMKKVSMHQISILQFQDSEQKLYRVYCT